MSSELIPFQFDTQRIVQLLAKQIYQSPLALLRENTQNAFDAVRQKLHTYPGFDPLIEISLSPDRIVIADNGIGMTPEDLSNHYWTAGSSSKNNQAARDAGVVGTFGIGAMANFGIADYLTVETESATTGQRTVCRADREKLDVKQDCIEREFLPSRQSSGTVISARIEDGVRINVQQARNYIAEFVSLVDIAVKVNGELVSRRPVEQFVPLVPEHWKLNETECRIGERMTAAVTMIVSNNADIWLYLDSIVWDSRPLTGRLVLRSGHSNLRTFRSGFGLATASVTSFYQFGGIADLLVLEPTAGREAITVEGLQLLQSMMTDIDRYVSEILAVYDEADSSTPFMNWIAAHNRYDLCGKLRISINPGDRIALEEVVRRSASSQMMLYEGADPGVVKAHASEDTPLLILARNNPRRKCEQQYLRMKANVAAISDTPVVKDRRSYSKLSTPERALSYRVESIIESDYFLKCIVDFGIISHSLPALVQKQNEIVQITLNPDGQTIRLLLGLFETEYGAFGSMAKDFVRNVLFPRIADHVPSSTRQGAEAFLKAIRRTREIFEYADDDLGSLPGIWDDFNEGRISLDQAVARSKAAAQSSVQVVDTAARAKDIVPDVIQNEQALHDVAGYVPNHDPSPGITRLEATSSAKLMIIEEREQPLRGYRCFLAVTDKVREEMGEFFLQPHTTSIVWGGQKTLFIFMHHSGQFGLYYDLQTRDLQAVAGGGVYPSCSIVMKNRLYIPIPDSIRNSFIPEPNERKRFEVRADILRTDNETLS